MPPKSMVSGRRLHACRRLFGLPALGSSALIRTGRGAVVVLSSLEDSAVGKPAVRILFCTGGEHVGQANDRCDKH